MNLPFLLMYLVFSPMLFSPKMFWTKRRIHPCDIFEAHAPSGWNAGSFTYGQGACLWFIGAKSVKEGEDEPSHVFLVPSQLPGIFTHGFFLLIISSLAFGSLVAYGCLVTRRIMLLRSPSSTHVRRGRKRNCVCFGVSQFRKCSP